MEGTEPVYDYCTGAEGATQWKVKRRESGHSEKWRAGKWKTLSAPSSEPCKKPLNKKDGKIFFSHFGFFSSA